MSRIYMSKYDEMRKGGYLMSNNHKWKACFQEDGNFVIYDRKPMWNSDTAGQRDKDNKMIWQTKCPASGGCVMMCRMWLCNDGTMVVERDGEEVWSSAQSKGFKQ
uniref:Bulb-type lectin domain-containing protein n=1 Tax=Salmo trutta TaxID=8032 RepID=A0A673YU79_SALTR